jgi:hypothetical protein
VEFFDQAIATASECRNFAIQAAKFNVTFERRNECVDFRGDLAAELVGMVGLVSLDS